MPIPYTRDPTRSLADQRREWLDKAAAYTGFDCILWPFDSDTARPSYVKGYGHGTPIEFLCRAAHGPKPHGRGAPKGKLWPRADCEGGADGCMNPHHVGWYTSEEKAAIYRRRREQKEGYPYGED